MDESSGGVAVLNPPHIEHVVDSGVAPPHPDTTAAPLSQVELDTLSVMDAQLVNHNNPEPSQDAEPAIPEDEQIAKLREELQNYLESRAGGGPTDDLMEARIRRSQQGEKSDEQQARQVLDERTQDPAEKKRTRKEKMRRVTMFALLGFSGIFGSMIMNAMRSTKQK